MLRLSNFLRRDKSYRQLSITHFTTHRSLAYFTLVSRNCFCAIMESKPGALRLYLKFFTGESPFSPEAFPFTRLLLLFRLGGSITFHALEIFFFQIFAARYYLELFGNGIRRPWAAVCDNNMAKEFNGATYSLHKFIAFPTVPNYGQSLKCREREVYVTWFHNVCESHFVKYISCIFTTQKILTKRNSKCSVFTYGRLWWFMYIKPSNIFTIKSYYLHV